MSSDQFRGSWKTNIAEIGIFEKSTVYVTGARSQGLWQAGDVEGASLLSTHAPRE